MESIEIGERVKELRLGRGMSQVALAKILNLNPQTVRDYETGRRTPTVKGLPALARALDVSISQLIEGSEELPEIKALPVSHTFKKLLCVPDDIYELAASIGVDHKAWDDVRTTLRRAVTSASSTSKSKKA